MEINVYIVAVKLFWESQQVQFRAGKSAIPVKQAVCVLEAPQRVIRRSISFDGRNTNWPALGQSPVGGGQNNDTDI